MENKVEVIRVMTLNTYGEVEEHSWRMDFPRSLYPEPEKGMDDEGIPMHGITTERLAAEVFFVDQIIKESGRRLGVMKMELMARMKATGSTELVYDHVTIQRKDTPEYDQGILDEILDNMGDIIKYQELVDTGAYTPERKVPVPRKWDVRYLRKFTKRGEVISNIVKRARKVKSEFIKVVSSE